MVALVLLLVLAIYISLAVVIVKKVRGKLARVFILSVFVLIPMWDIIPGRLYFNHLCKTEAGVKVFKTVEVDQSYFRPNGQPDEKKLVDYYSSSFKVDRNFSPLFHIAKIESVLQDKRTGEILGTAIDLRYHGGWLTAFVLPEGAGSECRAYPNSIVHATVWREAIKPKPGPLLGGN